MKKKDLLEQVEHYRKLYEKYCERFNDEVRENHRVNLEYMELIFKYNKLLDSIAKKDTDVIVFHGDIYKIAELSHTKEINSIDNLQINAYKVENQKGLIDTLTDTFKDIAKQFEKILYGDKYE